MSERDVRLQEVIDELHDIEKEHEFDFIETHKLHEVRLDLKMVMNDG